MTSTARGNPRYRPSAPRMPATASRSRAGPWSPGGLGGRSQPLREGESLLRARVGDQQRHHAAQLHDRERGRRPQVQELRRLAVDLDLERGRTRTAEQQHDPERGHVEEEDDGHRRQHRRAEQRPGHLAEGAERGRAKDAGCLLESRVEMAPQPADQPQDDREVVEDRGEQDRPDRPTIGLRGPSSARNAVATTTVGSTNGTVASARATSRPGNEKRANTHATGNPSRSVRAVADVASTTVNTMSSRTDRWASA